MGYSMHERESKFFIHKDNKKAAFEAIKALKGQETCSNTCDRKVISRHFMWVTEEEFENAQNLKDMLLVFGWDTIELGGHITEIEFDRSSAGDETLLFSAIAPFVAQGSYIRMFSPDDGVHWGWSFDGTKMK
ncbi:MAG: hypothetical protein GY765_38265, partial [bacterium]|nr:hypothetical protein [bacterium]